MIDIEEILTLMTANLVAGALLVSLVGATLAIAIRHKTSENWKPNLEDAWYYVLSGSVAVALVLMGADTSAILGATTGINTPLAVLRTTLDKRAGRIPTLESVRSDIAKLEQDGVNVTAV